MSQFNKVLKFLLVVSLIYLVTSIVEYLTHRFLMHNTEFNKTYHSNHLRHHTDVNEDMTLSEDHHDEDLFFNLTYTGVLFVTAFIVYYIIINKLFGYNKSFVFITILSIFISLFYKVSWDHLHYRFHMFHKIPYNTWNFFERLTFHNHSYHHLQKGEKKGNYCIVFLGADHLFRTFNTCVDNKEYCKKNYKDSTKKVKKLCDMEKNKEQLDNGLKFCNN